MNDKMLKRTIEYLIYQTGYFGFVRELADALIWIDPPRGRRFRDAITFVDLPGAPAIGHGVSSLLEDYIREVSFVNILRVTQQIFGEQLDARYSIPFTVAINDFLPNR